MALFSYDNMTYEKKNVISEKWKKFDSLQLWCLLRYKDMFYFLKTSNQDLLETDCQAGSSNLKVRQAMLETGTLLSKLL